MNLQRDFLKFLTFKNSLQSSNSKDRSTDPFRELNLNDLYTMTIPSSNLPYLQINIELYYSDFQRNPNLKTNARRLLGKESTYSTRYGQQKNLISFIKWAALRP